MGNVFKWLLSAPSSGMWLLTDVSQVSGVFTLRVEEHQADKQIDPGKLGELSSWPFGEYACGVFAESPEAFSGSVIGGSKFRTDVTFSELIRFVRATKVFRALRVLKSSQQSSVREVCFELIWYLRHWFQEFLINAEMRDKVREIKFYFLEIYFLQDKPVKANLCLGK